jgi:hypothetical protein
VHEPDPHSIQHERLQQRHPEEMATVGHDKVRREVQGRKGKIDEAEDKQ